jgi:hypothetical protein
MQINAMADIQEEVPERAPPSGTSSPVLLAPSNPVLNQSADMKFDTFEQVHELVRILLKEECGA